MVMGNIFDHAVTDIQNSETDEDREHNRLPDPLSQFNPPAPPTPTPPDPGTAYDQFKSANPGGNLFDYGKQAPDRGQGQGSALGDFASGLSYLSGAPGRGVDNLLPQGTPDYIRQPLVSAANVAPGAALAGLTGGGSLLPSLATAGAQSLASGALGYAVPKAADLMQESPIGPIQGVGDVLNSSAGPLGTVGGAIGQALPFFFGNKAPARPEEPPVPTTGLPEPPPPTPVETIPRPVEPVPSTPTTAPPSTGFAQAVPDVAPPPAPTGPLDDITRMRAQGSVDRQLNPHWSGSPPTIGPEDGPLQVAYKEGFHGLEPGSLDVAPASTPEMVAARAEPRFNPDGTPELTDANLMDRSVWGEPSPPPGVNPPNYAPAPEPNFGAASIPGKTELPANFPSNPVDLGKYGAGSVGNPVGTNSALKFGQELLYAPFGGDLSTPRNIATTLFNPMGWLRGENQKVVGAMFDALKSAGGKQGVMEQLHNLPGIESMGVKMHWAGEGGTLGRETMRSGILDKIIPGYGRLGDAYEAGLNAARAYKVEGFINRTRGITPPMAQTFANYAERVTSRGTLGPLENSMKALGPVFTSIRMMASIPQRASYLLPWTRLADGSTQMFGPVWKEAVIDHAGYVASIVSALELAKAAGLKVGIDPLQQTRNAKTGDPGFGKVRVGNTDFDMTFGQGRYVNAVIQAATGEKNGKSYPTLIDDTGFKGAYQGTIADFLRNSVGPIPSAGFAGAKAAGVEGKAIDYLRPDFWDKGVTGKGTTLDHVAQFVTPLWIQDVADAYNNAKGNKLGAGITAGIPAFFGAGVQSYPPSATEQRNLSLTPDTLKSAFPDSPTAQRVLAGKTWDALLPSEKAAISPVIKAQDPDYWAKFDAQNRQDFPATAAHSDTLDTLRDRKTQLEDRLLDRYNSGQMTKPEIRSAMYKVNQDYFAQKGNADKDPAYQKEIASLKASGSDPTQASRALDGYYAIGQHYEDPKQAKDAQAQYIKAIYAKDPELGARLAGAVAPHNQTALERLYSSGALAGR